MIGTSRRALLTLLAGGGLCGMAQAQQLPAGIDPSRIPAGIDLSRLPAGVQIPSGMGIPQIPGGGIPQIPSGGGFPQIPSGMSIPQLPAGVDPSQIPPGVSFPTSPVVTTPGGGVPAQGVAIQSGGSGTGPGVTQVGSVQRPKNRPEYIAGFDIQQIVEEQFKGLGSDVTYTEVTGNVGAQVRNRRIIASASYRLSYRIPERGDVGKNLNQNGIMRAQAVIIEELLKMEAGAIITRSRVDPGGAAPQTNSANAKNLTQTYSTFIQPSVDRHFGDLNFNTTYRFGYTKNDSKLGTDIEGLPVNRFDDSVTHQVITSIGMRRSELPFDWKTSLEYGRENASSLSKHSRSITATGELTLPVTRSIALVGSGGYERIKMSERTALIDPLTGRQVLDDNGRFVADPTAPRVITYDISGLIAEGGLIWKPSRRTRLEVRAGYRYDDITVTGLLEMKLGERAGLTFVLTDRLESFGSSISGGLAATPADLDLAQAPDNDTSYQNCVFGKGAGSGRCVGGALGGASANSYRDRSASLILSRQMRRWSVSASAGYSRRTYIDTPGTPLSLDGVVDQSFFGDFKVNAILTRRSGISFSLRGNLFKNGQAGQPDVKSGSFNSSFYRSFGRGIRLEANVMFDASKQDGMTADVSGRAQLGLQYQF